MVKIKIKVILFMLLIVTSFVIAADSELLITCGGDEELIINCFGDAELSSFESIQTVSAQEIDGISHSIQKEISELIEEQPILFYFIIAIILIILICIVFFFIRRKKKKEE